MVPERLLEQAVTGDHNRTISSAQHYHYLWAMMTGVHWADVCFGSIASIFAGPQHVRLGGAGHSGRASECLKGAMVELSTKIFEP